MKVRAFKQIALPLRAPCKNLRCTGIADAPALRCRECLDVRNTKDRQRRAERRAARPPKPAPTPRPEVAARPSGGQRKPHIDAWADAQRTGARPADIARASGLTRRRVYAALYRRGVRLRPPSASRLAPPPARAGTPSPTDRGASRAASHRDATRAAKDLTQ